MSKKEKFIYPPEATRTFFLKMIELSKREPPYEVVQVLHKKLIELLGSEEALTRVYQEGREQLFDGGIWPPPGPPSVDNQCQRH